LGDLNSITYSGSAKDVAFQQCGANAAAMICQGTHDPMRPINNYVRTRTVREVSGAACTLITPPPHLRPRARPPNASRPARR
jgi:hypothetical protein